MTNHLHQDNVRFTFDCPLELHTMVKMKAASLKQSLRDHFIGLLAKDLTENPTQFLDNKHFKKELKRILEEDEKLMKKLADR